MITLDKIYHAAFVLKEVARRTDLIHATNLMKDVELYLKTENLQVTGSFKLRGAYYKISQLTEEQKKAGIIACSAGNHAQGVALAATRQGARSVVYMPDSAPISKVEATKRLSAKAVELIDMTKHTGAHPRIGAVDVVPFIPVKDVTIDEALEICREYGAYMGSLGVPVYYYEDAATCEERKSLPKIRKTLEG